MAEFRRPSNVLIASLLARMDGDFLLDARCYFGGGTQLVLAHGEFRESRDIDLIVSSRDGIRRIRETVNDRSLGRIFKDPVVLAREVISDRDAVRTFIKGDENSEPVKFEVVYEGRIDVDGSLDSKLAVPTLSLSCAVAEKLLANTDRGMDGMYRSRDVIDLAFVALDLDHETFKNGYEMAEKVYGKAVLGALNDAAKKLEIDAKYRALCVHDLAIEDAKTLRAGLAKLRALKRTALASS